MTAVSSNVLRLIRRHAIALVAVFVSLGGTAVASHLVVRASDIRDDAVRARHINEDSVRQKQAHVGQLSTLFGAGIIGGQIEGLTVPVSQSGDESRPPIGTSSSVTESFDITAPRRMVVRDVTVDAAAPVVRRINLRIRAKPNIGLVGCVIEVGETSCESGNDRLVVPRDGRIDVWVGDLGPNDVELTENAYRFAYRLTP